MVGFLKRCFFKIIFLPWASKISSQTQGIFDGGRGEGGER
jgi:hypothetical protein